MNKNLYLESINMIIDRVENTLDTSPIGFPHYADQQTGKWTFSSNGDWTGGYWVGMLWLTYQITKNKKFKNEAEKLSFKLESRIYDDTVFRGMLFYYSSSLGSILNENDDLKKLGLNAANEFAKSFDKIAKVFPLGETAEETIVGRSETNIDTLMCTPLLWWSGKIHNKVDHYKLALDHAHTLINYCVRNDGSICQSASFNETNGKLVKRYTHKGFSETSCWSRGQAWGMLGYIFAYIYTKEKKFLEVAIQTSDYFINRLPKDNIPFYDFDDPNIPNVEKDTSAATIAAAALIKIHKYGFKSSQNTIYKETAENILESLIGNHLTPINKEDFRPFGILTDSCYNRNIKLATNNELIWGSYYFLESLCELTNIVNII